MKMTRIGQTIVFLLLASRVFGQSEFFPTWTCVNGESPEACNSMIDLPNEFPTADTPGVAGSRGQLGCVWASPTNEELIWIYGGWASSSLGTIGYADLWSFNLTCGEWHFYGQEGTNLSPTYSAHPNEPASSNWPGTRVTASCFTSESQLIMLGGYNTKDGGFNDIWSFDENTTLWNWLGGPQSGNNFGSPGEQGQFAPGNTPSCRWWSATWQLASAPELLWMHAGLSWNPTLIFFHTADLWVLNISSVQWAWINGPLAANVPANYSSGPGALMGGRAQHSAWVEPDQRSVYMFGGTTYCDDNTHKYLNDLWLFDTVAIEWTFVAGCQDANNQSCCLGTASYPSCRYGYAIAPSPFGLWIFGGVGSLESSFLMYNDLWMINFTTGEAVSYAGLPLGTADMGFVNPRRPVMFGGDVIGGDPWNTHVSSALWSLQACISGCLECGGLGAPTCQVCDTAQGFVLEPATGLCLTSCPAGQYSSLGVCLDCTEGCVVCAGPGLSIPPCSACDVDGGYVELANETACVRACPNGQFKGTSQCIPCTTGCSTCNGAGLQFPSPCSECDTAAGFYLNQAGTACVQGCPAGEFQESGRCEDCAPGCSSCSAYGLTIPPCLQCNTSAGFVANSSGQACVLTCPVHQFKGATACEVCTLGCLNCTAAGLLVPQQCSACNATAGFLLNKAGGACVRGCPVGQYNNSGICDSCDVGCSRCTGPGLDLPPCLQCNSTAGFVLLDGTECVSTCPAGQYKGQTDCEGCATGCTTCVASGLLVPTQCLACNQSAGYFLDQATLSCVDTCPEGQFQNDYTCFNCSVGCAACAGVGLELDGNCTACDSTAGFALNVETLTCQMGCPGAQYIHSGNCTACTHGCTVCLTAGLHVPFECLECDTTAGYTLDTDGSLCVQQSISCSTFQRQVGSSCELNTVLLGGMIGGGVALLLCLICGCVLCRRRKTGTSEEGRPLLNVADSGRTVLSDTTMRATMITQNSTRESVSSAFTIQVEGINVVSPDELEVLEELGAGGFGTVFRVRHRKTYTEMAMKLFHASNAAQAENFVSEATVIANLHHPSCLRCLGICLDPSRASELGLLIEFMPGGDLDHRMKQSISLSDAISVLMKVLQGLMYLHDKGLIHRDLKPGNILLDGRGGVVVADFGLVNFRGKAFTPHYAAPEVKAGGAPTEASDVYALGLIGLALLECEPKTKSGAASDPRRVRLAEAMQQACSHAPSERPACEMLLAVMIELSAVA